jgi:hypothetical protein
MFKRRLSFFLQGAPPDLDVSFTILAGETIHHLRTTLDHLAYQLVIAKTKKPPTFNSAFPIVGKGRMLKRGTWQTAAEYYAAVTQRLKSDISPEAEAIIRRLQPFNRAADFEHDPLWELSELDNAYKHRLLLLTVSRVTHLWIECSVNGEEFSEHFAPNIAFEDGAEIGSVDLGVGRRIAKGHVKINPALSFQIAFERVVNRPTVPVIDCLSALQRTVAGVVDKFDELPKS